MARGEHGPGATENDYSTGVIGLGATEGVVKLDEQPAVLGIAGVGTIKQDADDLSPIVLFVL